jgi:hypothetical protein
MSTASDLTVEEQHRVRVALRFLHVRFGTWAMLAKVLKAKHTTVRIVAGGHKTVTASIPPAGSCPLSGGHAAGDPVAPSLAPTPIQASTSS